MTFLWACRLGALAPAGAACPATFAASATLASYSGILTVPKVRWVWIHTTYLGAYHIGANLANDVGPI